MPVVLWMVWGLLVLGELGLKLGENLPHQMIRPSRGMSLPEGYHQLLARSFIKEAPDTNREAMKNNDDKCG